MELLSPCSSSSRLKRSYRAVIFCLLMGVSFLLCSLICFKRLTHIVMNKSLKAYNTGSKLVLAILPYCKVFRIFCFQFFKQFIHCIFKFFIILPGLTGIDKLQQSRKVLFFLRCLIPDVSDQCRIQRRSALTQKSSFDFSPSPLVFAIMVLTSFKISFSLRI